MSITLLAIGLIISYHQVKSDLVYVDDCIASYLDLFLYACTKSNLLSYSSSFVMDFALTSVFAPLTIGVNYDSHCRHDYRCDVKLRLLNSTCYLHYTYGL